MKAYEKQLQSICDKARVTEDKALLHKFVDDLDDKAKVLILVQEDDPSGDEINYSNTFGCPSNAELLWMTTLFRNWLTSIQHSDC